MSNEQMIKAMEHFYGIPSDMCNVFMKSAWEASWKASREELVIELPPPPAPEECAAFLGLDDEDGEGVSCMISGVLLASRKVIEAAGVKVKS
ncbi:hypothetical protein QCD74_09380 [Pseudomonas syringae pv. actinidiae]|uniref:hypothetical protein n=1 Tax=Pseudomonas syringae TaxID=317 RepID=UPI0024374158|nr:hypothetical protein [Pseudomonas syringae]MDG6423746.1 hypothetical protein [Pseudomonas syringae pv. actinidiae]